MHERKPDTAIFRQLLDLNHINAGECFFTDDTEMHIHAASQLGIQVHHLKGDENIQEIFKDW
jgi:HAD superfamily hydrolase (TIGR01509 family)